MKHSNRCKCFICQNVEPELIGTFYHTKSGTNRISSIEWDGQKWMINVMITNKNDRSVDSKIGQWTVEMWNLYCSAWRKDLCPEGIPNKGWRAGENHATYTNK